MYCFECSGSISFNVELLRIRGFRTYETADSPCLKVVRILGPSSQILSSHNRLRLCCPKSTIANIDLSLTIMYWVISRDRLVLSHQSSSEVSNFQQLLCWGGYTFGASAVFTLYIYHVLYEVGCGQYLVIAKQTTRVSW